MHWPGEESRSARGVRVSPLYHELAARGAVYGSRFGWERPNWFADVPGAEDTHAFDRSKTRAFEFVAREHRAVREGVALWDGL